MRTRLVATIVFAFVLLTTHGCAFMQDDDGDYHGERADPPDLTVRQSPSSTVRVGDTVTYTAVFRDSLNTKWLYFWTLNVRADAPSGGRERSVRWVAPETGTYWGNVWVKNSSATSRASIGFSTKVIP